MIDGSKVALKKIHTQENRVDIFTKTISLEKLDGVQILLACRRDDEWAWARD